MATITITRRGRNRDALTDRYVLTFSQLPSRFGPYSYADTYSELLLHTGQTPPEIRGLIFDAWCDGQAETDQG